MRTSTLLWILSCTAFNAQAADVVYSANQNDNTVSVIDADTAQKIGDIRLGYPAGDKRLYSPLYNGEINVHGLSYAPQRKSCPSSPPSRIRSFVSTRTAADGSIPSMSVAIPMSLAIPMMKRDLGDGAR